MLITSVIKTFLLLSLFFLISACKPTLIHSEQGYFTVNEQSSIEILQPLQVSPNSARAFLQNGELKPQGNINLYQVHCEVEINTVSEQSQMINPGRYDVISIQQDESPIVMATPIKVASLSLSWADTSPVDIKRYYYFRLSPHDDTSSPQVRGVTCRGVQSEPYNAKLPTLEEMKQAVGGNLQFYF